MQRRHIGRHALWIALIVLASSACSGAGIGPASTPAFVVVAGAGTEGYSGDGGLAKNAWINAPRSLAFDATGNLYFADQGNNVVRKVTPDGKISTFAGNGKEGFGGDGGLATAAQLDEPMGIATDAAGNVYIGDFLNARVRRVSPDGKISTLAGSGKPGVSGDGGKALSANIAGPSFIAVDAAGNLYIVAPDVHRVRRVSKDGKIATIAGDGAPGFSGDGGVATKARLDRPLGIAVDAAGNVYVADQVNRRVRRISPDGKMTTFAGSGAYGAPDKFEPIPENAGDGGPATSAILMEPTSVAVDAHGAVYVLVWDRIRVVAPDGIISTFAKADPDTTSIAVDAQGNVYASIGRQNQIVKFSAPAATR